MALRLSTDTAGTEQSAGHRARGCAAAAEHPVPEGDSVYLGGGSFLAALSGMCIHITSPGFACPVDVDDSSITYLFRRVSGK